MEATQKTSENTKKVLHKNCVCSECGQTPIEGIRYHCLVCQIYDICPKCEEKCGEKHGHQLLKLRRPHDLDKYLKLIYKKDEKENIKKMEEECEKNNKTEVKDFRDELDNYVKEIKQEYDNLFTNSSIRNALIRTKGNKENAIKILNTEKKIGKYHYF